MGTPDLARAIVGQGDSLERGLRTQRALEKHWYLHEAEQRIKILREESKKKSSKSSY